MSALAHRLRTEPSASPTSVRGLGPGSSLGRYRIVRRIARGGMAELYLACERTAFAERLVALKLVLPHLADDPSFVGMFLDEVRIASRLQHPNIVQVLDFGCVDEEYYLAMELVHGENVARVLAAAAKAGGLPMAAALTIVTAVAAGLHHAHELRDVDGAPLELVHRDVSPANVIVRHDGCVKVVDFGIARAAARTSVTSAGVIKGKVGYMAPEQCRGGIVDRRSDVFALGVLLYELSTMRRLFAADNDYAVMNRIVTGDVRRPSEVQPEYPRALEDIVMRALAVDPARRQPNAEVLRLELQAFAHDHGLALDTVVVREQMLRLFGDCPYPAVPSTEPEVEPEPRRWRPLAIAVSTIAMLATAAVLVLRPSDTPAVDDVAPVESMSAASDEASAVVVPQPVLIVGATDAVAPAVMPTPTPTSMPTSRSTSRRARASKPRATPPTKPAALDTMFPRGNEL